jgi:hypothetical protein
MGCGAGKKVIQESRPVQVIANQERSKYLIKVNIPNKDHLEFKFDSDYEELPLATLMNFLLFDAHQGTSFNANFISKYSKELKRYQYFIERLAGVPIENEDSPYNAPQWVVYLNEMKYEWDSICEKETIVRPIDSIRFQYELVSK